MKITEYLPCCCMLAGLSLIASMDLPAADFLVLNADDAGPGSLRQALVDANANGSGEDSISFESVFFSSKRTIALQSGLPEIVSGLRLEGPGAELLTVARYAGGNYPILSIGFADGQTVTISDLTLTGGSNDFGGGISAEFTTVNLLRMVVFDNQAQAGGGVYFLACNGTVIDSSINGNSAQLGGAGIRFQADGDKTLTVSNSTISGNNTTAQLGGEGTGITFVSVSGTNTLELTSSTVANNTTFSSGSALTVETMDGHVSNLNIRNTIIANPILSSVSIADTGTSNITSLGFNLVLDTGDGIFTATGDQVSTDPLLGELRYNGGNTPTHQLLPGSPARDAGDSSGLGSDQRGFSRPVDLVGIPPASGGDGADIGAVEMRSTVVTNNASSGLTGSLRRVIEDVNLNGPGVDVITFDPDFFNIARRIQLSTELPEIRSGFELVGPGSDLLSIERSSASPFRIFTIGSGFTATISHVSLRHGMTDTGGFGGAIHSSSNLTLNDVTLAYNQADESGGAVYLAGAGGTFSNCTMHDNIANLSGSAILMLGLTSSTLVMENCTISQNILLGEGAGSVVLASFTGEHALDVSSSTIAFNHGGLSGGLSSYAITPGSLSYVTLVNTIVAHNDGPQLTTGVQEEGALASLVSVSHNLVSDDGGGFMTAEGDQVNTDPRLAPLGNYGGASPTHALLNDSPAIDKGKRYSVGIDQRAYPRPADFTGIAAAPGGDNADIGAFEVQADIQVLNDNDSGAGSLRQAILDAVANGVGLDDIFFDRDYFDTARTIDLQSTLPPLSSGLNLFGPAADRLTVRRDSDVLFGILSSPNGWLLNVTGMAIANGVSVGDLGGGIYSKGDLTLTEVAIRGNTARIGGGVYSVENFTCDRCEFSNNTATDTGGGFAHSDFGQDMWFNNVTFSGNTALGNDSSAQGGAVYLRYDSSGDVRINSSTFVGNSANAGSAVFLEAVNGGTTANVQLRSVLFSSNESPALQYSEVSGGSAAIISTGYNLSDDGGDGVLNQSTDITGTDPLVAPLAHYGGPTQTHRPLQNSPALDAGRCAGPKTWDQRYFDRLFDIDDLANASDGCDIGAVEVNGELDYPENSFSDGFEYRGEIN